jgi:hypothetical protein
MDGLISARGGQRMLGNLRESASFKCAWNPLETPIMPNPDATENKHRLLIPADWHMLASASTIHFPSVADCHLPMPSRGRHQSTSKQCRETMRRIEAIDGVTAVIIGRSYGGKSLGKGRGTGAIRIQRTVPGGLKAVIQSEKGLQELFIRTTAGRQKDIAARIKQW